MEQGKLSRARSEIARLRNTLKAWVVIATVATGFALLLAFEVLELRDKLAGAL